MSPFFKLLASVSSLAMVTGSFLYSRVAEALENDDHKSNIPVLRVDALSRENNDLTDLINTLASKKAEQVKSKSFEVAQAPAFPQGPSNDQNERPDSPPGLGRQPDNAPEIFGSDAS